MQLQPAGIDSRQIENVVDDLEKMGARGMDIARVFLGFLG
jgi:hypothetical protein